MHLIIPFASISSDASSEASTKFQHHLKLPYLRQLLDLLTLVNIDIGMEESFSPPHERALARLQGLLVADGLIPWAAQKAAGLGLLGATSLTWSFVTLCHGTVGNGSMTMEDPAQLQVTDTESRQLLADMRPYFAEDGLTLHYSEPTLWLCSGEPLGGVRTASLDRVIGQDLATWQPAQGGAAKLRRLQNEMQMLLYTHTVNDARSRARTAVINSIWLHGTGELAKAGVKVSTDIKMPRSLGDAALKEDWQAWAAAWEQLDATACADLLKRVKAGESAGEPVTLTLCGKRSALMYELRPKSAIKTAIGRLKADFRGVLGLQPAYLLHKQL